jgi:calcium/calmodulin-dependent protein kinase I
MAKKLFSGVAKLVDEKGKPLKKKGKLAQFYSIQGKLGRGNFAVVRKVQRRSDGKFFAAKIIKKKTLKPKDLVSLMKEVMILEMLKHPNINQIIETFNTKKHLYMVLELLEGGNLFENIVKRRTYTEEDAAHVVKQVARACKYMHFNGIIHRDLKPENLVYLDKQHDQICVTGFGLSKYMDHSESITKTTCGTPAFVAPEVLRQVPYGTPVDMWSLGTILYIMLCGYPPFAEKNLPRLYKAIKKGNVRFQSPYWDNVSTEAKDCVRGLLELDIKKRMTPTDLLKHRWISSTEPSSNNLSHAEGYNRRFRRFVILSKMRRGVDRVLFLNRLKNEEWLCGSNSSIATVDQKLSID